MLTTFPLEKITYRKREREKEQEPFEMVWGPFNLSVKGVELADEEED